MAEQGPQEQQSGHEPRRRDAAQAGPPLPPRLLGGGDFVVRVFLLADHAAGPPDGKLYINGGGISFVNIADPHQPFPALHLAGRIAVPYALANEPHRITVRLLDSDRKPVFSDPLVQITGEVGRPAGTRPEDDLCLQFVVGLQGLPHLPAGVVFFHLAVDDQPLAALPLRIRVQPHARAAAPD